MVGGRRKVYPPGWLPRVVAERLALWEAILLGIVQGVTEWLPISSSGHLVLGRALFGIEVPLFFDLVVHVATLFVVIAYYRVTIWRMLVAFVAFPRALRLTGSWRAVLWDDRERRLALLVVLGSVPVAVAGFTLESAFLSLFDSVFAVGVALLFTGFYLWFTRYVPATRPPGDLRLRDAAWVGFAQAAAIAPGISRSGMTVGAATYLGLDRDTAVRYSFLLSIPTIIGATLFQASDVALRDAQSQWTTYLAGAIAAALFGYITLVLLVKLVKQGHLHWFSPYCWVVGAGAVLYALV